MLPILWLYHGAKTIFRPPCSGDKGMKRTPDQVLSTDLINALLSSEYFRERGAGSVKVLQLANRHVSTIYQVKVSLENGERIYWVKVCRSAEQEYRFLQDTYQQFRDIPRLSVVKPVTYLEDFSSLVTKHTNGELLSSRIKRRLNRLSILLGGNERVRRNCYTCGKWLALLHANELPSTQQYNREELVAYIDERLKLLVQRSGLDEGFCQQVLGYLHRTLSAAPPEDLVRVKTHGDYGPYNIMVSGDEVVVLDPSVGMYFGRLGGYCSRYEDIVHCSNFLNGMSSEIVGSRTRKALVSRFLEGYNDNSRLAVDKSSPVFKAFLVKYKLLDVLDTWPSIMQGIIGERGRVRGFQRWFQRICTNS